MVHLLREKRPRAEALDSNGAFTLDVDDVLRGWDPVTGKERWSVPTKSTLLAIAPRRVFLAEPMRLVAIDRTDGAIHHDRPGSTHPIDEIRVTKQHVVTLQQPGFVLTSFDAATGADRWTDSAGGPVESLIEDSHRSLFSAGDRTCYATFAPPDHRIECVALTDHTVKSSVLSLVRPTDPPGTRFSPRYGSAHHIVVGTWSFGGFKSTRRSAVVRLSDGSVAVVEDEVAAAVERADGTLEGLLVMTPEVKLLSPAGAVRWTYKMPRVEEFAAVTLIDDRLVIAGYNAIATGVQVFALNVNDGRELWKGETKLPPIGHSKYHNTVTIEALGDAVIVRGHESSVDHVHVYDSRTGALRFSDAQ